MSDPDFRTPIWSRPRGAPRPFGPPRSDGPVDLAIVGAGILGLSTAFHAARLGMRVQVLEAAAIGEGASGLSGGQVIPGLKDDPDVLIAHFGPARGERLLRFAAATADRVFDLIASEKLDVPHARNGWIQAAHTKAALARAAERDRQWRARGADVALLDAAGIASLTGARGYLGGWLDRRAGVIDPLAYTIELARIALAAGAHIAERQRVVGLRRDGPRWSLSLGSGDTLSAKAVVVATNAYTDDLVPGLRRTIVPLHSFQIATAPLAADLGATVLPQGQAVSDSRHILVYYRKTADGRLVLGGRGRMTEPTSAGDWKHLEHAMLRLYPQLAGVAIERRWFGRIAMTPDHRPHIHEPEKGLVAALGCQGRGIGLMTALGGALADYVAGGDAEALPVPLTPVRPIPFHDFRQIGVAAAITWYRFRDATEK